jgi:hypothetical protein
MPTAEEFRRLYTEDVAGLSRWKRDLVKEKLKVFRKLVPQASGCYLKQAWKAAARESLYQDIIDASDDAYVLVAVLMNYESVWELDAAGRGKKGKWTQQGNDSSQQTVNGECSECSRRHS